MIERYDKLVRDKIPDIIRAQGGIPQTETLDEEKYLAALHQKLSEELSEYLESNAVEELADLVEVIYALVKCKELTIEDFEQIRLKKQAERGGFDDRISLIEVENPQ